MEHISEVLKQVQQNTINKNMDTYSNVEDAADSDNTCPICNGAKFVHPLLPSGKPDYSQVVPCTCTRQEADAERKSQLQRYSNLGKLVNVSFDTLNTDGMRDSPSDREQYRKAYHATRKYAETPQGWLVLTGPSGCGKTYLAAAIASYQIENNGHVFYITTPDLLDHLRSSFSPDSDMPYDEFFEQVRNTPLLILDDLGAQSGTPWAKEKLEQLVNHRYVNQLPTVVIVIGSLDDLDERIRTRLVSASPYQLCAFDDRSPLLTYSWSPEFKRQKEMTFESFDWKRINLPQEQRDNLDKAYHLALDFAESPEGWLIFQGDNGCGKTHLAAAIVNYRYQHNKPAMFIVVPDFLDHLRSTFSPESRISYDRLFESVKNSPLLILDDFGKQTTTPWAQEKLFQVINHRYNAQLPTIVTTNASSDEMDGPILSRFADQRISTLFTIIAPDYYAGRHTSKNI
jgi:DNA replication protein DnaC